MVLEYADFYTLPAVPYLCFAECKQWKDLRFDQTFSSQLPAPKREVSSSTAYEDALARKEKEKPSGDAGQKKMSKAAMAAALFEKQRQEKAAARAAASESEDVGGAHDGASEQGADAQQVVMCI